MLPHEIPFWKSMPFFRMFLPFGMGIICAWYFQLTLLPAAITGSISLLIFLLLNRLNVRRQFAWGWIRGVCACVLLAASGAMLCWFHNVENHALWFGKNYREGAAIRLILNEPLSQKSKSWKAEAKVDAVFERGQWSRRHGKVIVYISREGENNAPGYGTVLITRKPLQQIANAGNPGGFDYKRYSLFNGITHQVYLKKKDYFTAGQSKAFSVYRYLYPLRQTILNGLQRYISSARERSIAEALLIGYRDHLDRDLVQMYSNTGVVHIIAISGLHLGLIYSMLLLIFRPLKKIRQTPWLSPLLIISCLWIFSLLAGASASVIRAALMFTFMAVGETLGRRTNVYNTLSASAFCMLCLNPFLLWDVGFQLSYAAVLGILIFMRPISNWFALHNKILHYLWQMSAVTISAQILTLPLCIYHFHQIPNLFLVSNIVAVPLGSVILISEILLVVFFAIPPVAMLLGEWVRFLLLQLNNYIAWMDGFRFAVTDGIHITPLQTIVLYALIAFAGIWLLQMKREYVKLLLGSIILFLGLQSFNNYQRQRQLKLIIYNVPGHSAMDLINGKSYLFVGDSTLLMDGFLQNFHLNPSRIRHGINRVKNMEGVDAGNGFTAFGGRKIVHYCGQKLLAKAGEPIQADLLVISRGARISLRQLTALIHCKSIIIDSSNPAYRIKRWQEEAAVLGLHLHATAHQGAFVLNL